MENALAHISEKVSPEAISAGTPTALKVGHINHAASIYGAFVVDADKQGLTTLETIKEIACTHGLTHTEFAEQCKQAQKMADTVDKSTGFTPNDDAKGVEKYGPKRRLLNQRLSEAKQLFGVFKAAPDILKEKGYWPALAAAREYLAGKNIKWDGTKVQSQEEKLASNEAARVRDALAETMAKNPMEAGETRAEYLARIDAMADSAVELAQETAFNKGVESLYESIAKRHGQAMLEGVFNKFLSNLNTEGLETIQHWIQEELVMCKLAEKSE